MTATMLVLEPIFEADHPARNLRLPCRAKRPAGSRRGGGAAVPWSPGRCRRRPRGLARRIVDRRLLNLIKMWLESGTKILDTVGTSRATA